MEEYAKAGVNRVSIGIQSLDDRLLNILGRLHNSKTALNAIHLTAEAGIHNISIDLMYDIPYQTLESWSHTLQHIKFLPITHLSLYNLTIEPHTVFFKYQESLRKQLPDSQSSTHMYLQAINSLTDSGLLQYEISAFAKNNLHSHHNIGYWTARPFLGLGPSSFSYWEGRRFRNVANLNKYLKSLQQQQSPIDFTEKLDPISKSKELLAIALRLCNGVNLLSFQQNHGPLHETTLTSLLKLEQNHLIERNNEIIKLSNKGILYYDTVAVEII